MGRHALARRHLAVVWTRSWTLRQLAARAAEPGPVVAAFVAAGRLLAAGHRAGVVHGGFSPDHALVDATGAVRLCGDVQLTEAARRCAAPERARRQPVDGAADQYSLAAALVEALAAMPRARALDPRTRRALVRALANEPGARWPSVDALVRELVAAARARRWHRRACAGALAALVVLVAVAALPPPW